MNVLSLFDGMSCGQIALRELGIKVDKYFASEIDKYAIAQTKLNFPETIHLGDVCNVKAKDLPPIDLLISGSPCQGFSFAGKQLNFNDPRSILFFEYVRILKELKELNPGIKFMLENVRMRKEFEAVISEQLGLFPVVINSALVSAQNRVRLYWTNILTRKEGLFSEVYTDIPQPQDKGLYLLDILEESVPERYYLSAKVLDRLFKHKENNKMKNNRFGIDIRYPQEKSLCCKVGGKGMYDLFSVQVEQPTCIAVRGREAVNAGWVQQIESRTDDKTNTLTSVQKDNLVMFHTAIYQRTRGENKGGFISDKTPTLTSNSWQHNNLVVSGTFRTHKDDFGFREIKSGKAATIPARAREDGSGQNVCIVGNRVRRLTPLECSRLQTIPSWYNWGCSETQRYKMLGNGWTVDVIKHIFQYLK